MQLRQTILLRGRIVAVAAVHAAAAVLARGESIQFSKPAVPIASPAKEDELHPEGRDKKPEFSTPGMEQPVAPRPAMIRVQPREKEKGDDDGRHPWLHDPKNFPDATGRANARNLFTTERAPANIQSSNSFQNFKRSEASHALSPITDFHWDPRSNERSNSFSGNSFSSSDKKDARDRDAFARPDSSEQNKEFTSSFFADMFVTRPKDKLTDAQLERRAAFERLLNRDATTMTARTPSSLEPVTALESIKGTVSGAIPIIPSPQIDMRPIGPMEGFDQRQARLRGPGMEDFNRKYGPASTAPAVSAGIGDQRQTPLMRQPTVHDIPTRKF